MLPFLLVLMFFQVGETHSWGISDVIDWTTDVFIKDYVQDFVKKCGVKAVCAALNDACVDLGIESCRSVAKDARDSYSGMSYYCDRLGSMFYSAAKGATKLAMQGAYLGAKAIARGAGYVLYYSGYALVNGTCYLLEQA